MNIKGAIVIIRNINNSLISDSDKIEAIKVVSENKEDPTIAITGHEFYDVALNWLIEKIEQKENSDIHNNSTDDAGKCERKENTDMSAVEFLKKWKRICTNQSKCRTCKLHKENICLVEADRSYYNDDNIMKVIETIKNWHEQHPVIELTEQQKTAIRGRIAEGTLWMCKDKFDDNIYFSVAEPYKEYYDSTEYSIDEEYSIATDKTLYSFVTFENSPIYLPDLLKENN